MWMTVVTVVVAAAAEMRAVVMVGKHSGRKKRKYLYLGVGSELHLPPSAWGSQHRSLRLSSSKGERREGVHRASWRAGAALL